MYYLYLSNYILLALGDGVVDAAPRRAFRSAGVKMLISRPTRTRTPASSNNSTLVSNRPFIRFGHFTTRSWVADAMFTSIDAQQPT